MREDLLHSSRGGSSQKLLGGPSIWGNFNNIIIDYYYYNSIVQYSTVCSIQLINLMLFVCFHLKLQTDQVYYRSPRDAFLDSSEEE